MLEISAYLYCFSGISIINVLRKVKREDLLMNIEKFTAAGKEATLYLAKGQDMPLVILNNFTGDGKSVMDELEKLGAGDINLLSVGKLKWDHDMTPWYCPPLSPQDTPCTGGADEYLGLLLTEILPEAKKRIRGEPSHVSIAGYSLAGLFAIYAMYKCDAFDRVASMSGSLWFPDFKDYCMEHEPGRIPDKVYLSLGDREAKTKNGFLKTVQENTESLVAHFRNKGMDVTWELNPGNHFRDVALRSAKGILGIL